MGINKNFRWLILLPVICWIGHACVSDKNLIEGIPVTSYYDSCDAFTDFGELIKIGDPQDKFMISLPFSWDIREHYTDTLYTIVAANFMSIPIEFIDRMSFTVSGYNTDKTLDKYYHDELRQLKKDKSITVEETGPVNISDMNCFWVKFVQQVDELKAFSLVVYIMADKSGDIFLLQSTVYDANNYNDKLCYMKQLVNTFEIEEN